MTETVLALANALGQAEPGEEEALSLLCQAAEAELTARLRPGLSPEDCHGAFPVAAAWLALAGMQPNGGGITAWSAGDVSVKSRTDDASRAAAYREQAERLMAPYCVDDSFAFLGVEG